MPWSAWRVRHAKWGKTCNQRYLVGENRKGSGRWGRIKLGNWPLAPTYSLQPICFSNTTQHFLYYSPYLNCLYSFPASHIGRIKSFIPTQDIQTLGTIPWKHQVVFSKKQIWVEKACGTTFGISTKAVTRKSRRAGSLPDSLLRRSLTSGSEGWMWQWALLNIPVTGGLI